MKTIVEPDPPALSTRDRLVDGAVLLGVAVPAVLVAAMGESAAGLLRYERGAVLDGQFWRLIGCHWVHLGPGHLVMNLAAWLLIWLYAGRSLSPGRWLAVILAPALAVGLGLLWFHPQVAWYVGLSGLLHGTLAAVALGRWRGGDAGGSIILALLALKLAWEQLLGPLPGSESWSGGPVLVIAHVYGALGGLPVAAKSSLSS